METGNLLEFASTVAGGTISNVTTSPLTGSRCLEAVTGGGFSSYAEIKKIAADGTSNTNIGLTTVYMSFGYYHAGGTGNHGIVQFMDSAGNIAVSFERNNSGGNYWLNGATASGSITLSDSTWYDILLKITQNGTCELSINNASGGGITTCTASNFIIDKIRVGSFANGATVWTERFDDIVVSDTVIPSGLKVNILTPNGVGSNSFTSGTYTDVDEIPHDSDTTYVEAVNLASATINIAMTSSSSISAQNTKILAIKATAIGRKVSGTATSILSFRQESSELQTGSRTLGASFESTSKIIETQVVNTSFPLTGPSLDDISVSIDHTGAAGTTRHTQGMIEVLYDPFSPKRRNLTGVGY